MDSDDLAGNKVVQTITAYGAPSLPDAGLSKELIKAMAMDAGKSLCAYLEVMFPKVWHGQNSGFKISMKHHVYNDIMSLTELHDEAAIRKRLADNEAHRKEWLKQWRKIRRTKREKPTRPMERLGSPKL